MDVVILAWFAGGVAEDSEESIKDYNKVHNKVELCMYALWNAMSLCNDLIFIFGQTMKITTDENA